MNVLGYTETGSIRVEVDGIALVVPDDLANRHRREIAEWEAAGNTIPAWVPPPPTGAAVNAERERRISLGTVVDVSGYGQIPLQGRDVDQINLLGLAQAASLRIASGDTTTTTVFRDAENANHQLTPPQIIELWSKGSAWISQVYAASWAIKELDPIPSDFADDSRWP